MALDELGLELLGDIALPDFVLAVGHFRSLLDGLGVEAEAPAIRWEITDLERSSAHIAVYAPEPDPYVEPIVRSYGFVGKQLEAGHDSNHHIPRTRKAIRGLVRLVHRRAVDGLVFHNAEESATVRRTGPRDQPVPAIASSYGAILGRIQTLSNRGHLRFTLYDTLNDRAVSCYLKEGNEDTLRVAWGRPAVVVGWVHRDPVTGRPVTVRQSEIVLERDYEPDEWRRARGLAPSRSKVPLASEDAIARWRNWQDN